MIDGEKGGVGKSVCGCAIIQYFHDFGIDFVAVAADRSQAELVQIFDGKLKHPLEYAYLTEDEFESYQADNLAEIAVSRKHHVIVDLPAQTSRAQDIWLKDKVEGIREEGATFVKWFVTSGEENSVGQFCESVEKYGAQIPHILVRNQFFTKRLIYDFSDPELNQRLKEFLEGYKVPVIELPAFMPRDLDIIRLQRFTFGEATAAKELGVMGRQRIKNMLKTFYEELEQLEVIREIFVQGKAPNTAGRKAPTRSRSGRQV